MTNEWVERDARRQQVKRIFYGVGRAQHECPLTEVVEQERREHQSKPGNSDGPFAGMAHIGVRASALVTASTTAPRTAPPRMS